MPRNFTYPPTRTVDVVDNYHGTPVPDPYRWLEDPDSPDTQAWIEAQNKLTFDYLAEIPARATIHKRLTELWNYPKTNAPEKRGSRSFYLKNDGLQNQPVLYQQDRLNGQPSVLLDPNTLSDDGTVALISWQLNKAGSLMAYTTSSGGSDWQEIHVRNVETGRDYDEVLRWSKFASIAWHPDDSGFYYNRFPEPESDQAAVYDNKVYFHKVGTPQSEDVLIYERPDAKELNFPPIVTDDGRYLVLWVYHGAINRNRIYYRPIDSGGDFVRLLDNADAEYAFVGSASSVFYFSTDKDAPHGRIIAIDVQRPDDWREIVPQADDTILNARIVNQHLVITYMHHAHHQIKIYTLAGRFVRELPLPEMGSIAGTSGKPDDTELFFEFESYLSPMAVYCYDFVSDTVTPRHAPSVNFKVNDYETRQVFFTSKDGTRVPMFITAKKGLKLDGNNPTWVYGYGGYSIPHTPTFFPWLLNWLEMGGVFVDVNLRGGSEYGEEWHQAGMLGNKQNVFDDFIAACEWLIEHKYTRREKLAIYGRSNGGLLVAACMTQRPDLFGAVLCVVPVTDMLRFHKFTAGRYWVYEYGNAEENADHFQFMYAYSPLHNVQDGTTYPPILITTADHDDRVVPLHSLKFAARLQAADSGKNPLLLRVDVRSGHALGKPTWKWIDEWADIQAFLVRTLGIQ